ncbi:MAG: hypothetical protein K5868_02250 [Lachnospiraceae bacterium]|nr:hypothetical protein [Lachnospiraceae bacterium]
MEFMKRSIRLLGIIFCLIIKGDLSRYRREIYFLIRHGLNTYPYEYIFRYNLENEVIGLDEITGNNYVLHNGRRIYFPISEKYTGDMIKKTHFLSVIEQDVESPHRYLDQDEDMSECIFFDVGCQEASLPLDFVDKLKHLYLFEADEEWNTPLSLTFKEWNEKVTVVNKFVSDSNSNGNISLSSFILQLEKEGKIDLEQDKLWIKMDIEGSEETVFADLISIMKRSKCLKIALCLYHKYTTEDCIRKMLPEEYIMRTRNTYMLFQPFSKDCRYPFFRHGVARIERK